jgi:hypothetical protein
MSEEINIVDGFSLLNRWLLYASVMLAPAHFLAGWRGSGFTSLGFHAFNWYNQVIWYNAAVNRQLGALSLLPVHFNIVFCLSYLGGLATGHIVPGIALGLGTGAVMIFNTVTAWKAWAICQPMGYGEYQFFFFGWRTLTDGWHKFFLVWQIGDSIFALNTVILALSIPIALKAYRDDDSGGDGHPDSILKGLQNIANLKYPAIIVGAALMLLASWPLILWVELIVQRNHIDSPTDWNSVWLFIVQACLLIPPDFGGYFSGKFRSLIGR